MIQEMIAISSNEVWKPINLEGFKEFYEVSSLGRVRSKDRKVYNGKVYYTKGRVLKTTKTTTGYRKIDLVDIIGEKKSFKVHRLVALTFIGKVVKGKNIINHIDGNPLNNNVSNLEWCTQKENIVHAYETGLINNNLHKNKDQIVEEYVNNPKSTINGLAKKYECSVPGVRSMLLRNGIRLKKLSELQDKYKINKKELIIDFKKGLTNKEIAKKHNTNPTLIATYKYNYKKRGVL